MITKDVNYYLHLPYHIEIVQDFNTDNPGWVASVSELPGCLTQADTFEELQEMISNAMSDWIETAIEENIEIPEPRDEEEYSGKFNTRVPKSLHRKLVEAADREEVSLNQWINTALAEAVGSSAANIPARAAKTDQSMAGSTWPGLATVIQQVLDDVGMGREAGEVDERLFAGWLEQNLEEIDIECRRDDYEQALSKSRALFALLQEYENRSPVMHSIQKIVAHQVSLIEQTLEMKQTVLEAEKMQAQISAILGSVNSPALGRIHKSENERHSMSTSLRAIELTVREPEPVGW